MKIKKITKKLTSLQFYEDILISVLRFFTVSPFLFIKKKKYKSLFTKDPYEKLLIATLRFLIKRSPLKLLPIRAKASNGASIKYADLHPYQSASASLLTILLVFGGAGYFLFNYYASQASAWWNDDWHYRKPLTINSSQVTADLTNFPMLVSITDGDLASNAQADGDDIVFTLNQGNKLDHEIESYDATTGTLVAWVRIPELDGDNDSTIYMYYGNPSASSGQVPENVWDENFVMVQHMEETPTVDSSAQDSTREDNNGTFNGTMTNDDQSDGKIGGSLAFDGSDDYVEVAADESHEVVDATISGWFKVDSTFNSSTTTSQIIMEKFTNDSNHFLVVLAGTDYDPTDYYGITDGSMVFKLENDPYSSEGYRYTWTNQASWTADTWYHFALISDETDGTNNKIYINGVDDTLTNTGENGPSHDLDATIRIGGSRSDAEQLPGGDVFLEGAVDEVKLSGVVRSADWISTEFNNQNSPATFLTVGTQEKGPSPVLYLPFDEGFGTTAHDESSAHNDATISGAQWADESMCKTGKCLQFDGNDYLEIDDDNTLDLRGGMTMEAWVKPTSTDRSNQTIIAKTETPDEPTKIYRSVGPGATSAITTGASNAMTITGTTAKFASALPNNVGVGDAIQYDSDGDSDIDANDSIVFIIKRLTSSEFRVNTASGGVPTAVNNNTSWSLFRAYTSLANAEAGTENTGIDADLVNFDTWSGGKDISSATGSNEQWNIACYANGTTADTTAVGTNGWTTSTDNYLKFYTPYLSSEVGVNQRHEGVWDDNKYKLEYEATGQYSRVFNNNMGAHFFWLEGIQIKVTNSTGEGSVSAVWFQNIGSESMAWITSNIIWGVFSETGSSGSGIGANDGLNLKIWNNIIYDFINGSENVYGINGAWGTANIYNNTILDSYIGIGTWGGTDYIYNNSFQNCSDSFSGTLDYATYNITDLSASEGAFGSTHSTGTTDGTTANKLVDSTATFLTDGVQIGSIVQDTSNNQYSYVTALDSETQLSVNDDIFTSGESYSVYTNKYGSVTFRNEAGDDFRLAYNDTIAIDQGTDLSADSDLAFTTDVEGDPRDISASQSALPSAVYDIGADEYVATKIYRSVGPGSTEALEEGTTSTGLSTSYNPMTIVGDTATFTEALADNVGVGDAIQYDDDDDGDIDTDDSLAFITGRISNTQYTISNAAGAAPTEVDSDTDWSLFRSYTSLDDWEDGIENTGIDSDLRTFDTGNRDIATNDEQWNVACYADANDTSSEVEINGWTTAFHNYIKIYTPVESNEVGVSQRHEGVWSTDKYILDIETASGFGIDVKAQHVKIEGLQIDNRDSDDAAIELQGAYGAGDRTFLEVSHNIMWGNTGTWSSGTYMREADLDFGYVYNNIAYDWRGSGGQGFYLDDEGTSQIFVYNNTVFNSTHGIRNDSADSGILLKNNVIQDCDVNDSFVGTLDSASTHNITDDSATEGAWGSTHSTGTTDSTSAGNLADSTATFQTDGVQVGSIVQDTSNTQYSYVTAVTSETSLALNDDIFVSGENYSVFTNLYGSVDFVDEAGDDFHLDTTDSLALEQGVDLSSDPYIKVTDDIDGDSREGNFSIGADEGTPTKIYRSVGPGNTTALATGTGNDMTITPASNGAGGIATFDEALPDRIGVGDAIQYDDDGDGDIDANDSIAFISGRISGSQFSVQSASGGVPTTVTDDEDWSIFRAYTSLSDAESAGENTGIDSDLRNFDTWTNGRDLVTNGEQWNIACYGDDMERRTSNIGMGGNWTTSEDNYLRVYTPFEPSEVGTSQRHKGIWTPEAYGLIFSAVGDYMRGLILEDAEYMRIEGLQIDHSNNDYEYAAGMYVSQMDSPSAVYITGNLLIGHYTSSGSDGYHGVLVIDEDITSYISNNIIEGFEGVWPSSGLRVYGKSNIYNNTISNCNIGITVYNNEDQVIKNNAIHNCDNDFYNYDGNDILDHNASDDGDGTNAVQPADWDDVFRDPANQDFRLKMSDTDLKGAGLNLYNDDNLPITTDIEGEARPNVSDTSASQSVSLSAAFDVGADQASGVEHNNYSMSLYNDSAKITSSEDPFSTYGDDIPANRWTHISYTRDSTDQYLYINGTQRQTSIIDSFLNTNNGKLYIGSQDDNSNNSFQGFIDEIRIYPYARTKNEIQADKAAASSGRAVSRANEGIAASFGGGADNFMSDGLVAYYKMDEGGWGGLANEVIDSSGNGNHGTAATDLVDDFNRADNADVGNSWEQASGATDIWDISGNKLRAQPSGTYASNALFRPSGEAIEDTQVTVDFNTTNLANYPQIWVRMTDFDTTPTGYLFYISNHSTDKTGVIRIEDNSWAQTWTAETNVTTNNNYRLIVSTQTNGSQVDLTMRILDLDDGNKEVFNHSWSDTSASRITGNGRQALSGYSTGTIMYDNFNVTSNNATTDVGKFGNGYSGDGTGDYVDFGTSSFGLSETNEFSTTMWIRLDSDLTAYTPIFQRGQYVYPFRVTMESDEDIQVVTRVVGGTNYINANVNLSTDTWYHVVSTFEDGKRAVYIDGEMKNSDSLSGTIVTLDEDQPTYIGSTPDNVGDSFPGDIDEVRIYNRALSANEVKTLYEWAPGPVMHLKMDEKVAGDAQTLYDSSGNEMNGTTNDGDNDSGMGCDVLGKYGHACDFDGVDDVVSLSSLPFSERPGAYTISLWVDGERDQGAGGFLMTGGAQVNRWGLHLNSSSGITSYVCDGTSTDTWYGIQDYDDTNYPTGWHHITLTDDGTTRTFYRDGAYVDEFTNTIVNGGSVSDVYVGQGSSTWGTFFEGKIDDVRLYDYARTQDQIIEDMNAGHPAGGSPVGSPVAHWSFEEGYGDTAHDMVGSNDGTLNAGSGGSQTDETEMWSLDGKSGKAMEFDEDDDVVTASASGLSAGSGTVSFWATPNAYDATGLKAMFYHPPGTNDRIYITHNDAGLDRYLSVLMGNNTSGGTTTYQLQESVWSHILVTWDGSTYDVYADGELYVEDGAYTGLDDFTTFYMGDSDTSAWSFGGKLDEVKIYNYAMTADQVNTEFNQGKSLVMGSTGTDSSGNFTNAENRKYCVPGSSDTCNPPVLELDFDEKSGTTAFDKSGNGNDGTLGGGTPSYAPNWSDFGKIGAALEFDGVDDYVELDAPLGGATSLSVCDSDHTISAWFRSPDLATKRQIYAESDGGSSYVISDLHLTTTGTLNYHLLINGDPWELDVETASSYDDNQFHHVTATRSTNTYTVYVDGALQASSTIANDPWCTEDAIDIGREVTSGGDAGYFSGIIDTVRLFDYARTPAQIAWDYNRGKPIGWWKLDESSGATAHDASGKGNDGTLTSMDPATDWVSGKMNNALDFDGSNDKVDMGNIGLLDGATSASVCFWLYYNPTSVEGDGAVVSSYPDGWMAWVDNAGANSGRQNTMSFVITDSGDYQIEGSENLISSQTWDHYCVTYEASSFLRLYKNNVLDQEMTTAVPTDIDDGTNELAFGQQEGGRLLNAKIDDVRVYNYALTQQQIKEVYNEGGVSFR